MTTLPTHCHYPVQCSNIFQCFFSSHLQYSEWGGGRAVMQLDSTHFSSSTLFFLQYECTLRLSPPPPSTYLQVFSNSFFLPAVLLFRSLPLLSPFPSSLIPLHFLSLPLSLFLSINKKFYPCSQQYILIILTCILWPAVQCPLVGGGGGEGDCSMSRVLIAHILCQQCILSDIYTFSFI